MRKVLIEQRENEVPVYARTQLAQLGVSIHQAW